MTDIEQLDASITKALGETPMQGNANKSSGLTDKLHLRVPLTLKARLAVEANHRSKPGKPITPSDVVREVLEEYFAQRDITQRDSAMSVLQTPVLTTNVFQGLLATIEAKKTK